jgi:hypothetical protein
VTAEWLTERYDVDIRCYRLALARHNNDDFLTGTRTFPPRELTDLAIRRRRKREIGIAAPASWSEALSFIDNQAVVKFFQREVGAGRAGNPGPRILRFSVGGRVRFRVYAKRQWARVNQFGRFDNDIEFWKSRLGERADVTVVRNGQKLRFYLFDDTDFDAFGKAATVELVDTEFSGISEDEGDDEPSSGN